MSNMKCPFCQHELDCMGKYTDGSSKWLCNKCGLFGDKKLFDEIIRIRKALDVAVDVLKEQQRWFGVIRVSLISHLNNQYGTLFKSYDADPTVVNVKRANDILNTAIKKITALEQKDVK